jgi:cytochrome c oxidase assembly protein subunit 19
MNTPRNLPPSPPARGSFPLDHGGECKAAMARFLACMRAQEAGPQGGREAAAHNECKGLSKDYLQCRMQRGLMAAEDLDTLGFSPQHVVTPEAPEVAAAAAAAAPRERIAGMSAAKKQGGFIFGLGGNSTGVRGGGHG